jgi:hypothetical protein
MSDHATAADTARSPFDTLAAAVPMLRVAEREARLWRRFWRSSALTLVLMPLMFLGAIGLGLGGLVDENTASVGGSTTWPSSRPASSPPAPCRELPDSRCGP